MFSIRFPRRAPAWPMTAGAFALLSALAGCGSSEPADPRTQPPLVSLARAVADGAVERSFTGVVAARVESDLGFRIDGKVVERRVDAGQRVKRGDLLMRLDASDVGLGAAAQRELVRAAHAQAEQAAADLARLDGLVEAGAVSAQTLDAARAADRSARARLAAAQAQAEVALNADRYSELRADADGVVLATLAEPGQVVKAGDAVLRLARDGAREARVDLPEGLRPALGSTAQASVWGGAEGSATLRELAAAADPRTRSFAARYTLGGAAAEAPIGSTVSLRLALGHQPGVVVPIGALHDAGPGPGVFVVDRAAARVNFRPVTVARLGADSVLLSQGLAPGDTVVALGAHLLHDGDNVRLGAEKAVAQ
ncbi:efflux RND transporter periplasmic adaptor subunit [Derxia lacustris]|uniref:efflux RND transporter periplasmic adaptor subunit n=1 Tax=Derxia lacustris TaxID=764842 RepID=UPI001F475370|nr:efflux RND transporter periplasmic adaptor subunit [Derxia lacustris]